MGDAGETLSRTSFVNGHAPSSAVCRAMHGAVACAIYGKSPIFLIYFPFMLTRFLSDPVPVLRNTLRGRDVEVCSSVHFRSGHSLLDFMETWGVYRVRKKS